MDNRNKIIISIIISCVLLILVLSTNILNNTSINDDKYLIDDSYEMNDSYEIFEHDGSKIPVNISELPIDEENETFVRLFDNNSEPLDTSTYYRNVENVDYRSQFIRVGSFDLYPLTVDKISNQVNMNMITDVISKYDIISIHGIPSEQSVSQIQEDIIRNVEYKTDSTYASNISAIEISVDETNVYSILIYNTEKMYVDYIDKSPNGNDGNINRPNMYQMKIDGFNEPIWIVPINCYPPKTEETLKYFTDTRLNIETMPENTRIVMMGPMYTDGIYFNENGDSDYSSICNMDKFIRAIDLDMDTTVNQENNFTYDQVILSDHLLPNYRGTSGVYYYDLKNNLLNTDGNMLSSHYPVFAEINTDVYNDELNSQIDQIEYDSVTSDKIEISEVADDGTWLSISNGQDKSINMNNITLDIKDGMNIRLPHYILSPGNEFIVSFTNNTPFKQDNMCIYNIHETVINTSENVEIRLVRSFGNLEYRVIDTYHIDKPDDN